MLVRGDVKDSHGKFSEDLCCRESRYSRQTHPSECSWPSSQEIDVRRTDVVMTCEGLTAVKTEGCYTFSVQIERERNMKTYADKLAAFPIAVRACSLMS